MTRDWVDHSRRTCGVTARRLAVIAGIAAALALSVAGTDSASASFTPLTLENGWVGSAFGTASAAAMNAGGITTLEGGIEAGTAHQVFTLPAGLRPAARLYAPVDQCNRTNGRLVAEPTGVAFVQAEGEFGLAQCFTSLDGVWFASTAAKYTRLALLNGWEQTPDETYFPAARAAGGIVRFEGAAQGGHSSELAVLPAAQRPQATVYIPADMCAVTNGRLVIRKTGQVTAESAKEFSVAKCFVSLDGASFAQNTTGYTPLTLENGWGPYGAGTYPPGAKLVGGAVHLEGAISGGTGLQAFVLPKALRPKSAKDIKVDMCNATNGRLLIEPSGAVIVEAETTFSYSQCFTSLDGASFVR